MLTMTELSALERGLRSTRVLSVFLSQAPADPALHHGWRVQIEDVLREVRTANAGASDEDRVALEQSIARFHEALDEAGGTIRHPGWVAFLGGDRVHLAQPLPVATGTSASWGIGIRVAPLLRATKEARPAIVALVDSRRAQLYRYQHGQIERVDTLRAHAHEEPVTHMGTAAKQRFHAGTRGRTGTDQAQRERLAGRRHLMAALAKRMVQLAEPNGWLLIGGAPVAASEAVAALPAAVSARAHLLSDLHLRATLAELKAASAGGARLLRRQHDLELVRETLEAASGGGRGASGREATMRALTDGRASRLFLTPVALEQLGSDAEPIIRAAFDEGAEIEVVTDRGAELLDTQSGGIAATLRYAPAARGTAATPPLRAVAPVP